MRARARAGRIHGFVPVLALAALAAGAAAAGAGPASNAFVTFGGGPRDAALGGHLVALPIGDDALTTNPARLAYGWGNASAQVDRLDPDLDLWHGRLGAAFALGGPAWEPLQATRPVHAAAGVSIEATSLTLIEGSSYREATFTGGLGVALANFGALGVAGRYDRAISDVDGLSGHGYGIDFGASLELTDHWDAAIAIRNAFGRTRYESSDDQDRAAGLTIGLASARRRLWQAELDYVLQYDHTAAVAGGLEVHAVPGVLDLRGGLSRETARPARTVGSAGFGLWFHRYRLDYAYRSDQDGAFDQQHRLALGARF